MSWDSHESHMLVRVRLQVTRLSHELSPAFDNSFFSSWPFPTFFIFHSCFCSWTAKNLFLTVNCTVNSCNTAEQPTLHNNHMNSVVVLSWRKKRKFWPVGRRQYTVHWSHGRGRGSWHLQVIKTLSYSVDTSVTPRILSQQFINMLTMSYKGIPHWDILVMPMRLERPSGLSCMSGMRNMCTSVCSSWN